MRRSRFSEEQLIGAPGGARGGGVVSEVRDQGRDLLQVALEVWRVEVSETKRLRSLAFENARLKRLLRLRPYRPADFDLLPENPQHKVNFEE